MKKLLESLSEELSAGRGAVLCSITAASGSTPRGPGAKMLVKENGGTVGTIGGGAAEYQAMQYARTLLAEKRSATASYKLTSGDGGNTGMICGGEMTVCFQYFDPAEGLPDEIADSLSGPQDGTVYLFGAGHVGRALCQVLALADFRVVVWDQRPDAAVQEYLPGAAEIFCGPYDSAVEKLPAITSQDYVVVMTPGHKDDYTVLTQVLRSPAKYIGCIGSRKKVAATREKLLAAGFSEEEIDRVHAPIGLPTGGDTPGEIAVSVAAEMIACRWGRLDVKGGFHAAN